MLSELYVRNFAIIDDLRVQFDFGFNVLTGETGTGKSIILDALGLILGGRGDSSMVRAGTSKAIIEATFELTPTLQAILRPILEANGLDDDAEETGSAAGGNDVLVLSRELRANGRSLCRINGITVSVSALRDVGDSLVDIHGQGDHLSLLLPKSHLPILDDYASLRAEREAMSAQVTALQVVQRQLKELRQNEKMIAQRIEFLEFQVQEIGVANLKVDEEGELRADRTRLANVEQLTRHTALALALLEGAGPESPAAMDLLGQVERSLLNLARLDPTQNLLLERLQGLVFEFNEVVGELRDYHESLEFEPNRLNAIEERLELINRLKRKYGTDIAGILASREEAAAELDKISNSEERIGALTQTEEKYLRRIGQMGQLLSQKRRAAAQKLAKIVEQELGDLRLAGARFEVSIQHQPDLNGAYLGNERVVYDHNGIDQVEFLISTNPGEPLKPMAKVASGGETSRLMLALKTALTQVDATPTLIFDEVDQGIGGRIGDVVGYKLWGLTQAGEHQVIVVTHLPQLAGYGDGHLQVSKAVNGGRTTTEVRQLDRVGRLRELGAMLGTGADAHHGAEAILQQVAQVKKRRK